MYDAASTIMAQKLSQITGVGQVTVGGSALPAVRVELNPTAAEQVWDRPGAGAHRPGGANANTPKGDFQDGKRRWEVGANDQIFKAIDYEPLVIAYRNGSAVRISDVGEAVDSVEDMRNAGYANGKPSVLVIMFRQPGANIIDTVDRIRAVLPQLEGSIPHAINLRVAMDQTITIRASVHDVEITLLISISAGDPGGFRFPAKPADHVYSERRRSGFADRNVRRDVSGGLQHRQSVADGADHFHRICGGRRDRGDREHHALHRTGHAPVPGRARRARRRSGSRCSPSASRWWRSLFRCC